MTRKVILKLMCVVLLILLCGCNIGGAKSYQGNMEIPEDGIVKESVLSQIKEDHAAVTFTGSSNGYKYEWTIFGDDIAETRDINLKVIIDEKQEKDKLTFSFESDEDFGFSPVLSIYLNSVWSAQKATVYNEKNETVCEASVTDKKNSILNFTVNQTKGKFYISSNAEDTHEDSSLDKQETEKSDKQETEKSDKQGTAKSDKQKTEKNEKQESSVSNANDSKHEDGGQRVISDGTDKGKDKYETDPIPEGKPRPVEPEDQKVDSNKTYTCTFSIECSTILNNLDDLNPDKMDAVPSNGIILSKRTVKFSEGESVFDVLQRLCRENNIHMESSWTPIYNSAYVEGIHNLYEFDCGELSGWMYRVNGWYPNYGCSRYVLAPGEVVEWRYTCDLGKDVGCDWLAGS